VTRRADEIAGIAAAQRTRLDARHRAREATISAARGAIQSCAASIRATHRGEFDNAVALADQARAHLDGAELATEAVPDVRSTGPLADAKKEYAEARLTLAFVRGDPLPTPDELGVEAAPYLNGMAEAASELRRQALDCLRRGELDRAESLLLAMDDVYSMLVTIDYPDAVTGGLRRTTDALRAVLERTRGDLTTTMVAARLQASIEAERARRDGD
jgi:translin